MRWRRSCIWCPPFTRVERLGGGCAIMPLHPFLMGSIFICFQLSIYFCSPTTPHLSWKLVCETYNIIAKVDKRCDEHIPMALHALYKKIIKEKEKHSHGMALGPRYLRLPFPPKICHWVPPHLSLSISSLFPLFSNHNYTFLQWISLSLCRLYIVYSLKQKL